MRLTSLREGLLTPDEKHVVRRVGIGDTEHAVAGNQRFTGGKDEVRIKGKPEDLAITAHSHPGKSAPIPSGKDIASIHQMLAVASRTGGKDEVPSHTIVSGDGKYATKFTPNKRFDPDQDVSQLARQYERTLDTSDPDDEIDAIVNRAGIDVEFGEV